MKAISAPQLLAAILLSGVATGFAQSTSPSVVRWRFEAPNAVTAIRNGSKIEGIKMDDVHIYVALYDLKDTEYNGAWVQIANHGQKPINLDPQSAFLKDGKVVRPEEPEKVANGIRRLGEAKSQELASPTCSTMNSGGGSGGGKVSASLECRPTNMQVELSKEVLASSNVRAEWVRDKSLTQTTVGPGEELVGAILFRKGKTRADYVLAIPVGNKMFEFPVSAENRLPSYD